MKFSAMPYERIDRAWAEAAYQDLIARSAAAASAAEQLAVHRDYYKVNGRIDTSFTLAMIRHDIDTTDEFYKAEKEYADELSPVLQQLDIEYHKQLYRSPWRAELEKALGPVLFQNIEMDMRAYDDSIVALRQQENALSTRYSNLLAAARIEFEGKVYNLAQMAPFTTHADRAVRKKAWEALRGYYLSVTGELDEIYDALVQNRTAQARQLGFENFVELGYLRMQRNSYDRPMVENFRRQVKEYFVPLASQLHEARRARLGVERLCHYDNGAYFPNGNPAPTGTPAQILAAGRQMYAELGPETQEFFDFMQQNELFDVLGRANKAQGGYQAYLDTYRAPFIFANFNGTSGDVDVITHECGHAFQAYLLRDEPVREAMDLGMETAEIHSMSMEYFTYPWMERFFGPRAGEYLQMHLEDSITFVPYGCMVDEFQHIVYEHPELTPAQRKAAWARLEAVYRPHLHYDDDGFLAGAIWQRQMHIYQSPFYYIDYCLAATCAMQLKIKMDEDWPAAWQQYLKLCRLAARDRFTAMLAAAGLQSPFEDGCLARIAAKLAPKALGQ